MFVLNNSARLQAHREFLNRPTCQDSANNGIELENGGPKPLLCPITPLDLLASSKVPTQDTLE